MYCVLLSIILLNPIDMCHEDACLERVIEFNLNELEKVGGNGRDKPKPPKPPASEKEES